ncbi:uncharacterized protein V1518DRAFT_417313 [Limtongia smithiae]|uniref:uncharacterized protein n=1 Tax=Limtongia smithiae TaxID=1125753 RepID=UPI0034CDC8A8
MAFAYFARIDAAVGTQDTAALCDLLAINAPSSVRLVTSLSGGLDDNTIHTTAARVFQDKAWANASIVALTAAYETHVTHDLLAAYKAQHEFTTLLSRIAEKNDRWIVDVLARAATDLRAAAMRTKDSTKLEEAARTINRALTVCLNDRSTVVARSRKWGVYFFVGLLFKIYFSLGTISLATSVVRVLTSSASVGDLPRLNDFPKAHVVVVRYYLGILAFMDQDYDKAVEELQMAANICHKNARINQELILLYLIPAKLVLHHKFPQSGVWLAYPKLRLFYEDLFRAAKRGDLRTFDACLAGRERVFVVRRIYLTMLRVRSQIVRPRLFEQVYRALGKSTRIPTSAFLDALRFVGVDVDEEQVECWAAVMIYQGRMKGYISRERHTVVLSNTNPFPN